uniref:Ankyrin repeat domain-containing protein 12 n=1 Tax=Clastoptera arizonana TaxID=38151 RepID=A0A1B6DE99_9HEMI
MRRQPQQNKVDKSGSPRVTLRIHQLKAREEKKDKLKNNSDVESIESSNTMEPGGNKGGATNTSGNGTPLADDTQQKETTNSRTPSPNATTSPVEQEKPEPSAESVPEKQPSPPPTVVEPPAEESSVKESNKRHSSEEDEETKKKRRKEDAPAPRGKSGSTSGGSPKSTVGVESEGEEGIKSVESPGPKVPPLKIVIPSLESEQGTRNGKNGTARHHQGLPYVVASGSSEPGDVQQPSTTPPPLPSVSLESDSVPLLPGEDQRSHQRVLRSSHRSGGGSSSGAPSGSSSPIAPDNPSPRQVSPTPTEPPLPVAEAPPEEKPSEPAETQPPPVELHPRKRKLKPRDIAPTSESSDSTASNSQPHNLSHDHQISNCYQLFLNIRKQIDRRRKGLFPVQPKPPQGFKDYLMNRCTYVLAGNAKSRLAVSQVAPPTSLQGPIIDLFIEQEKERYRLRTQHVIEKEKLVLSVEQEILRVHGRAARALANQSLPFSVCTILRDEEVYSAITPEQEEKDRNARSRYNGRLFLSWLQDVDDKWEKIKEAMLLRHHNEAESLHAVQKMDWEWKMKELGLCEFKAKPVIEESHVPMVHVSDDFDLLPAY